MCSVGNVQFCVVLGMYSVGWCWELLMPILACHLEHVLAHREV